MRGLTVNVLSALFVFTFSLAFRLKCSIFAPKRESKRLPRGKINHFQCPKFLKECLICVFEDIQKAIEHF